LTLDVAIGSDGRAEVHGEPGVTLAVPETILLTGGRNGKVVLACRPEDVAIDGDAAPGFNRLSATVEAAAYLGDRIEYSVRTVGGKSLLVVGSRRQRYDVGETVGLCVDTSEATLWTAEGTGC
jgi:ABC-type Fe3+/spermidine/putrescine transport system ATPase subunit